jgi:Ca2+-binding RTX toxin-like protein
MAEWSTEVYVRTWGPYGGGSVRKAILLFSMVLVMLALESGVALADVFTGTDGPDTYWGPVDNDSITGLGGNDFLVGDPTPYGAGGDDLVSGGAGDDRAYGASGDDSVSGGTGNDDISGSLGSDVVAGGDGDDNVSEGPPFDASTDVVFGGAGDDLIDAFNEPPFMDIVNCGPGDDLVYADGLDNLVGCEEVILGPEPDPWDQIHNN